MANKVITHEIINTLTPEQTAEVLRLYGVSTTPETIRKRVLNRQYDFGAAHVGEAGNIECTIYAKKFIKWLNEVIEIELIESNGMSDWTPGGEQPC